MKAWRETQPGMNMALWTIAALLAWTHDGPVYYLGFGFILLALIAWQVQPLGKKKGNPKSLFETKHILEPFKISATFNFPGGNGHIDPAKIPVGELEFPCPPTNSDIKAKISLIIYKWLCDQVLIDFVTEELKFDGNEDIRGPNDIHC